MMTFNNSSLLPDACQIVPWHCQPVWCILGRAEPLAAQPRWQPAFAIPNIWQCRHAAS